MKIFIIFTITFIFVKLEYCYADGFYLKKNQTILYINNQNNKDLGILIKPKLIASALLKDLPLKYRHHEEDIKHTHLIGIIIPAYVLAEIVIFKEHLGIANIFSVSGETNPITPTGKCANLKFGKIYYLWFINDNLGTTCVSQELGEPLTITPPPPKMSYKNTKLHIRTPDDLPERFSQAFPLGCP